MKVFLIISGIVLWSLIIMFVSYLIYEEIRWKIRKHNLHKKVLQYIEEQRKEREIMDKLKENSYEKV